MGQQPEPVPRILQEMFQPGHRPLLPGVHVGKNSSRDCSSTEACTNCSTGHLSNQLENVNLGLAPDSKVFVCAPHCRATAQSRRTSPLRSGPNPALTRSAHRRPTKLVFHFCFLSDETGTSESNGGVHGAFSGGGNSATGEPAAFCGFVRGAFPAPRVGPGGLAGAQARGGEFSQSLRWNRLAQWLRSFVPYEVRAHARYQQAQCVTGNTDADNPIWTIRVSRFD